MSTFLEFRKAKCRDCYKCLRECPVKAIDIKGHQAKIIEDRCILCGHCTIACPQNAKVVHSELDEVKALLEGDAPVVASVAPSFISSFALGDFTPFKLALAKLGFTDAEETAVGAQAVVEEYKKLLLSGKYDNLITSACPAACRMIREYYPKALKFLAPVDSPMIAHAKLIRRRIPEAKVVFIGPCIAKKREAAESGLVENVLTYEDMVRLFGEKGIRLDEITNVKFGSKGERANLAKAFPINRGVIKSFDLLPEGYEYIAVDGPKHCAATLGEIEHLHRVFLEINVCQDACVNGPCSLEIKGGSIKATTDIREYVKREVSSLAAPAPGLPEDLCLETSHPRIRTRGLPASEAEIESILKRTGKCSPEDELNCGACGYPTCREKAWAVYNGYADIELCIPYMRKRAESLSYEVIRNSPEGIIVIDSDMKIVEVNGKGMELLGIRERDVKGRHAVDFFQPVDFMIAYTEKKHVDCHQMFIPESGKYLDISINYLQGHDMLFGIMNDITESVNFDKELLKVKQETIATTDEVIKKQMRVAQEIASLLGETTAETKVALLKLKKTLTDEKHGETNREG